MAAPTLTDPPSPAPNRSMPPSAFSAAADAHTAWQPVNVSEMRTALTFIDGAATTASNAATTATTQASTATTQATKAQDYAIRTGSVVPGTSDWSAKEHAVGTSVTTGSAKDWASKTSGIVAGTDYSAKYYAQQSQTAAAAAQAAAGLPSLAGNAGKALTVNSTATGVEWSAVQSIGDVLVTAQTLTAPKWLLCDGSVYLKSSYTTLSGLLGSILSKTPFTYTAGQSSGGSNIGNLIATTDGKLIYGTNSSSYYVSTDSGLTWSTSTATKTVQYFASLSSGVLVGVGSSARTQQITRSTNNGDTWATVSLPSTFAPMSICSVSTNGFIIVGGAGETGGAITTCMYSNNSGSTWASGTWLPNTTWYAVGSNPNNGSAMAVGGNGSIAYTTNGGATWTAKTSIGIISTDSYIYSYNNTWVVVTNASSGNNVFLSKDDGNTWTGISLPNAARCITSLENVVTGVVIGGDKGVYYSEDGIESWRFIAGNPQNTSHGAMAVVGNNLVALNDSAVSATTIYNPRGYDKSTSFAVPTINPSTTGGVRAYIKGAA